MGVERSASVISRRWPRASSMPWRTAYPLPRLPSFCTTVTPAAAARGGGLVLRAVVDHQDLVAAARPQVALDLVQGRRQAPPLVVGGDHHRQQGRSLSGRLRASGSRSRFQAEADADEAEVARAPAHLLHEVAEQAALVRAVRAPARPAPAPPASHRSQERRPASPRSRPGRDARGHGARGQAADPLAQGGRRVQMARATRRAPPPRAARDRRAPPRPPGTPRRRACPRSPARAGPPPGRAPARPTSRRGRGSAGRAPRRRRTRWRTKSGRASRPVTREPVAEARRPGPGLRAAGADPVAPATTSRSVGMLGAEARHDAHGHVEPLGGGGQARAR